MNFDFHQRTLFADTSNAKLQIVHFVIWQNMLNIPISKSGHIANRRGSNIVKRKYKKRKILLLLTTAAISNE
jgi:hypothetical protein